ncbi:MAG: transposon-transfer assisting family protein [Eubacteriales bacterium]|nr:transposon-transfer assisting family protein [Eubacteriales bacterium]
MMHFTDDEWTLMMIYNPGTDRQGMIVALEEMQSHLTNRDRNLRKWTKSLLSKLEQMTDASFAELDLYPDI